MTVALEFDIGCLPRPLVYEIEHPVEETGPRDGFVAARRYARATGRTRINLRDYGPETWAAVLAHWNRTYGGTLRMDFVPPDGTAARTVRFARPPQLIQSGHQKASIVIDLEDAP